MKVLILTSIHFLFRPTRNAYDQKDKARLVFFELPKSQIDPVFKGDFLVKPQDCFATDTV